MNDTEHVGVIPTEHWVSYHEQQQRGRRRNVRWLRFIAGLGMLVLSALLGGALGNDSPGFDPMHPERATFEVALAHATDPRFMGDSSQRNAVDQLRRKVYVALEAIAPIAREVDGGDGAFAQLCLRSIARNAIREFMALREEGALGPDGHDRVIEKLRSLLDG